MAVFKLSSTLEVRSGSSKDPKGGSNYLNLYSTCFCVLLFSTIYLLYSNHGGEVDLGLVRRGYGNVTLLIVSAVIFLLWAYLRQTYSYWSQLGVPCTVPTLIVGHTLRRFGITMSIFKFYDDIYHKFNGKDFCGFYDFLKPGLIVGDLQLMKSILVEDFDHFANRRTLPLEKVNPIANEMLSNATGEDWRRIRTAISPAFTAMKLRQLYPLICQRGDAFVQMFKEGKEIKIQNISGRYTLDTIASCAFGIECDAMNTEAHEFTVMAGKVFIFSPIRALKIITLLTVPYMAQLIELLGADFTSPEFRFFHQVISKTLRIREEKGFRRGDFLDLMRDTKSLSETTMTAQAILFLLAGYDNIANTLSFALHNLATHPKVQNRLFEELSSASKSSSEDPNGIGYEELCKLPILDAVVNETLRLYPASPVIERICTKDYIIPGTTIPIKKGQPLIFPIWSIHRDPKHWLDPDSFKPERFENTPGVKSLRAFMPFGAGPRQCIGMKFATLVIKVGLMKTLQRHEVLPSENTVDPPPLHPRGVLSIRSTNCLPIIIKTRS